MNGFACITLLSEVYLGPRNNLIYFGDDPDYDPDRYPYHAAEFAVSDRLSSNTCIHMLLVCNYHFASIYLITDSTLKRYVFCLWTKCIRIHALQTRYQIKLFSITITICFSWCPLESLICHQKRPGWFSLMQMAQKGVSSHAKTYTYYNLRPIAPAESTSDTWKSESEYYTCIWTPIIYITPWLPRCNQLSLIHWSYNARVWSSKCTFMPAMQSVI